ncbi:hypothetical protein DSO57_1006853 [Entomophthora muscae]|uniref:Uncharacterized protein n=1 Tax=Entomophthora muscae TaxID=34485 RepID=A0ACC2SKC1_9FUNG|nr:hypothetical protein DSO57_1006853 [Entomophthora muscae]
MHIAQEDTHLAKKSISLESLIESTQHEEDVSSVPCAPDSTVSQVVVVVVENHHYHTSIRQELEVSDPPFILPASDQDDDSCTITSVSSCSPSIYSSIRSSLSIPNLNEI